MPLDQRPEWWSNPGAWLREGIEEKRGLAERDEFGRPRKEGLIDGVVGGMLGADDGADYRKAAEEVKFGEEIEALDGKFTPGKTKKEYEAQIRKLTLARQGKEHDESPQGKAAAAQLELLRGERDTALAQFKYLQSKDDNRYDLARAEALEQKAENRRDRLDLLDRQDHRYSQEMQRYDKRRQTETIQSLIGGLASLGAAFAI